MLENPFHDRRFPNDADDPRPGAAPAEKRIRFVDQLDKRRPGRSVTRGTRDRALDGCAENKKGGKVVLPAPELNRPNLSP